MQEEEIVSRPGAFRPTRPGTPPIRMDKEVYRIFSLIFHRPDPAFARYLRSGFLTDIQFLGNDVVAGFADFINEHTKLDDEEFFELVSVEYTRLFVNAVPNVPCPPYESVYREGMLMGLCTQAVLNGYQEVGLKILDDFHELPDHLAVELEFLYYVSAKGDQAAHDSFLREHLSTWMPAFGQAVQEKGRLTFYKLAAAVLVQTVSGAARNLPKT